MLAARPHFVTKRLEWPSVRGRKFRPAKSLKTNGNFCHEMRILRFPDLLPVLPNSSSSKSRTASLTRLPTGSRPTLEAEGHHVPLVTLWRSLQAGGWPGLGTSAATYFRLVQRRRKPSSCIAAAAGGHPTG